MAVTKKEILQNLVDKMQQMVESGDRPPWQRPWEPEFGDRSSPHNPITGNAYSGFNRLNLALTAALSGYSDPRWMGYRQAADQGWQVRKGEKATYIHLPVEIMVNRDKDGSPAKDGRSGGAEEEERGRSKMLVFKRMPVFNAQQIDGIPPLEKVDPKDIEPKTAELDAIADALGVTVRESPGDRAFYRAVEDLVVLPVRSAFLDQYGYDSTKAHELAHATGHEGRLGRDLANRFGSVGYASEEVTAEIGAFLLCQELGVPHHGGNPDMTEEQHATYLASWATVIRDWPELLSKAIDNGIKAAGYMNKALDLARERGLLEKRETAKAMEFARGDYVRYRDEVGMEREALVLDPARIGEPTRLRRIYRWPEGVPGMDGADHIAPTVLPEHLVEHISGAVQPGPDLDAIDPRTDAYKRSMWMRDSSHDHAQHAVLTAVETARGVTDPVLLRPHSEVNKQIYHKVVLTHRADLADYVRQEPIDPDKPVLEIQAHPRQGISGVLRDYEKYAVLLDTQEFGPVSVEIGKPFLVDSLGDDYLRKSLGKPVEVSISGDGLVLSIHNPELGVTPARDIFASPATPFGLMPLVQMDRQNARAISGQLTHVHDTNVLEVQRDGKPLLISGAATKGMDYRRLVGKEVEVKPGFEGTLSVAMARVRPAADLIKAGDYIEVSHRKFANGGNERRISRGIVQSDHDGRAYQVHDIHERDRAINNLLDHPDWQVRANGIRDVIDGMRGDQIHRALEDPDSVVRLNTLFLANQHGLASRIDEPHALHLLTDPAPAVRGHAVGIFADRLGREGLEDFLERETHQTPRGSAERALLRLQAEEQRLHPQFSQEAMIVPDVLETCGQRAEQQIQKQDEERAEPTGMHDPKEEIGEDLGWER